MPQPEGSLTLHYAVDPHSQASLNTKPVYRLWVSGLKLKCCSATYWNSHTRVIINEINMFGGVQKAMQLIDRYQGS